MGLQGRLPSSAICFQWTGVELVRIELAGQIRERPFQVQSDRARSALEACWSLSIVVAAASHSSPRATQFLSYWVDAAISGPTGHAAVLVHFGPRGGEPPRDRARAREAGLAGGTDLKASRH